MTKGITEAEHKCNNMNLQKALIVGVQLNTEAEMQAHNVKFLL